MFLLRFFLCFVSIAVCASVAACPWSITSVRQNAHSMDEAEISSTSVLHHMECVRDVPDSHSLAWPL